MTPGHTQVALMHCRRYVDFPITDVLQMMGRAGRPRSMTNIHRPIEAGLQCQTES